MDREFLKGLGLEKDAVDAVMAQYGKDIQAIKVDGNDIEKLKQDLETTQTELNLAKETISNLTTEKETLTSQIGEKESEISKYQVNDLKRRVALETGLPYELADRLDGEDEESIRKDAESMAKLVAPQEPAPLGSTEKEVTDHPLADMLTRMNQS